MRLVRVDVGVLAFCFGSPMCLRISVISDLAAVPMRRRFGCIVSVLATGSEFACGSVLAIGAVFVRGSVLATGSMLA